MKPKWLRPLEDELGYKIDNVYFTLPNPVWQSDPTCPGTCVLRRFLIKTLDEALRHVRDNVSVRAAVEEAALKEMTNGGGEDKS